MNTIILIGSLLFASQGFARELCPKPWTCAPLKTSNETLRAGFLKESAGAFKGNIIYFEGLGDSMLNHAPLFTKLTRAGYRVIAFDYPGQGGATGHMNDTRISQIPRWGELAWRKFARGNEAYDQKTIIGWSTGGLAAFLEAKAHRARKVVLIAPGIAPKALVGETDLCEGKLLTITTASLTTADLRTANPHVDPIRPNSPLKVPAFAASLLSTAIESQSWKIADSVKGLVLLSGEEDTYVDAEKTKRVIQKNAPHFETDVYPGALHEIDNEVSAISNRAHADILAFLNYW